VFGAELDRLLRPCGNKKSALRRMRLRQINSARVSGSPAGRRSVAACLGRLRPLPLRDPPRCVQQQDFRWVVFFKLCINFSNSDSDARSQSQDLKKSS
jgi:hypothetical protein